MNTAEHKPRRPKDETTPTCADAEDVVRTHLRHKGQRGSYALSLAILAGLMVAPALAVVGIVALLAAPRIGLHPAAPYLLIAAPLTALMAITCAEIWQPPAPPATHHDVRHDVSGEHSHADVRCAGRRHPTPEDGG